MAWKKLPKDPGPGTIQGKVPPIQPIMPPGATEEEVFRPTPVNRVKPKTGLEGGKGSKSAN